MLRLIFLSTEVLMNNSSVVGCYFWPVGRVGLGLKNGPGL